MKFLLYTGVACLIVATLFLFKIKRANSQSHSYPHDGMVLIPAGVFFMGSTEKDGVVGMAIGVDEIPRHSVLLKAFYIDKFEVTNSNYKTFLDATGHPPPTSMKEKSSDPMEDDLPVTQVSWNDADNYCLWAGKRLPTEEEWEKAARGTDGRQWPWGNEFKEDSCNVRFSEYGRLLPVGTLAGDRSPYGVYDMCGNVSEWTSSWYLPYPGSSIKRESFGEIYKITRGGSWIMSAMPYSRVAYRANTSAPDFKHRGIGFRCVKDIDEK